MTHLAIHSSTSRSQSDNARCWSPAAVFCVVPECPACGGAVLLAFGMHSTPPGAEYERLRFAIPHASALRLDAILIRRRKDRRCSHVSTR
jgi:hypothetical protein